ncbi:hypothetical protein PARHAE_02744 [Paracoccus haematequi]|uniref:Uncharacterized protein n=1 Tax=Paracoccus haematequi TaxID=2491866 RepID=A0A447IPV5_9RHOB|nr:hypothetical protein PARHAE_02744 [Paracoccus haematequi]
MAGWRFRSVDRGGRTAWTCQARNAFTRRWMNGVAAGFPRESAPSDPPGCRGGSPRRKADRPGGSPAEGRRSCRTGRSSRPGNPAHSRRNRPDLRKSSGHSRTAHENDRSPGPSSRRQPARHGPCVLPGGSGLRPVDPGRRKPGTGMRSRAIASSSREAPCPLPHPCSSDRSFSSSGPSQASCLLRKQGSGHFPSVPSSHHVVREDDT